MLYFEAIANSWLNGKKGILGKEHDHIQRSCGLMNCD